MKNLQEAIFNIDSISEDATIFATRPFQNDSKIKIVNAEINDIHQYESEGMYYFLEVVLLREVIEVWKNWHSGQVPSIAQKIEAAVYYAEHDAYLP